MKHTVIIGGGFAGVNLARELARSAGHRITLIDKNNYNFFPPLIYQVAAGFMSPSDISYPFRKLFNRRPNARFRRAKCAASTPPNAASIWNTAGAWTTTSSSSPPAPAPTSSATKKSNATPTP